MIVINTLRRLGALLLLASLAGCATTDTTGSAKEPVKALYHLNQGLEQASDALRNVGNHLSADPAAKIVVVTHAKGIDFLLPGAKDANGNAFASRVEDLSLKGVEFRVCNITLENRKIDPKTVHPDAKIVPSGVAEVAKLQFREGFAYVKP
jgi:intracellular sulfur oxidation DsrE/DsrF family protein